MTDELDRNVASILAIPIETLSSPGARPRPVRRAPGRGSYLFLSGLMLGVVGTAGVFAWTRLSDGETRRPRAVTPHVTMPPPRPAIAKADARFPSEARPVVKPQIEESGAPLETVPPPPPPPTASEAAALARSPSVALEPQIKAERAVARSRTEPKPLPPIDQPALLKVRPPAVVPLASRAHIALAPPPVLHLDSHTWTIEDREPERRRERQTPRWVSGPTDDDVSLVYPLPAWRRGIGGSVVLQCVERVDGSVSHCHVLQETPPGAGFGRAALALSGAFRFEPTRVRGRPAEILLTIPYDFSVAD